MENKTIHEKLEDKKIIEDDEMILPRDIIKELNINVVVGKYKLKQTLHGQGVKFIKECNKQGEHFNFADVGDHPRHDGNTTIFSPYTFTKEGVLRLKSFCDKAGFKLSVYTESIYGLHMSDFVIQH